ncbi:hypothetical protein OAQ62_01445 [bacterium]|nr:hypothetical protein [bacterium]
MKYLMLVLALVSFSATAATVINYDDGSTLTLKVGEMIHVTKDKLYQQRTYSNGKTIQFKEFPETSRRDYVEVDNGTDVDMTVGSHAWCTSYIPWSEGLTFTMVAWQRFCDSNGDGVYDENDQGWEG